MDEYDRMANAVIQTYGTAVRSKSPTRLREDDQQQPQQSPAIGVLVDISWASSPPSVPSSSSSVAAHVGPTDGLYPALGESPSSHGSYLNSQGSTNTTSNASSTSVGKVTRITSDQKTEDSGIIRHFVKTTDTLTGLSLTYG